MCGQKSQIQPLDRTQLRLALAPGVPERLTQKYIRRGTHRSSRQLERATRHCIEVSYAVRRTKSRTWMIYL